MQIPSPKNEGVTNPFPKLFLKRVVVNEIDDLEKENIGIPGHLRNPGITSDDPIDQKTIKLLMLVYCLQELHTKLMTSIHLVRSS